MNELPPGVHEITSSDALRLDPGMRVFLSDLDALPAASTLASALSEDERTRAARFVVPEAAISFVRRRWLRRRLLALAHDVADADVRIATDPLGRPTLTGPVTIAGLPLSTSSSGHYALVAWRPAGSLGVDIARAGFAEVTDGTP